MSSSVRPRSVSRSRVTVIDPGDPDNESLDPVQLLDPLLSQLKSLDGPLIVKINDSTTSVEYPLSVFTSKLWPIRDNHVIFGFKRILFKELTATITVVINTDVN